MRRIAILFLGLLAAIPAFSQTAPPPAAPPAGAMGASGATGPKGPHPKSNAENDAIVAMGKAPDPDAQIKAAEDLLKTYPDTDYKAVAFLVEAEGYNQKRDYPKAIVLGEKSLAEDSKNYGTLLLLADVYSRTAKATDFDLNDKLTKSDKYAKEALAELEAAPKPKPELSDAAWTEAKTAQEAQAWMSLGFSAVLRKKFDDAKTDFEKSITMYPDPLAMLYVERAYAAAKQYDEAIVWADKAAVAPSASDQLKSIAGSDKKHDQDLKKAAQSQ